MTSLLIICVLLGAAGAYSVSRMGATFGLLDTPNRRSSHSRPTPKGGGIGILAAFLLASLTTGLPPFIFLPITLIALLSMIGDRKEIAPAFRLVFQLLMILLLVASLFLNDTLTIFFLIPFWVIFLAGTANFYNFMDGINGIAAITGVIGFSLMAFFLSIDQAPQAYILLAAALGASCLGFLPFNLFRAKVFMGDIGSILLGLVFAMLVMLGSSSPLSFICYASLLFPFYIDELTTMIIRLRSQEKLTVAHRKHIYQILANEHKIAHWEVSCGFGALQIVVGIITFFLRPYGLVPVCLFLLFCALAFTLTGTYIRQKMMDS